MERPDPTPVHLHPNVNNLESHPIEIAEESSSEDGSLPSQVSEEPQGTRPGENV